MYPFFLYHRMISYKYKFSKTETFILKRLAQSFKGAITWIQFPLLPSVYNGKNKILYYRREVLNGLNGTFTPRVGGGVGDSAYERGGDARRLALGCKFRILVLLKVFWVKRHHI